MVITYNGENYFKIQSGDLVILVDPTDKRSLKGASFIINTLRPAYIEPPQPEETQTASPVWIDHQGEYEVKGTFVRGWSNGLKDGKEQTIYRILVDDVSIACLGHLTRELEPNLIGELGSPDIVIIPGGGKPYITETSAGKLLRQLEPSIIIPSLYKELKSFLKEMGGEAKKPEEKLVLKKKDLSLKAMDVRVLTS